MVPPLFWFGCYHGLWATDDAAVRTAPIISSAAAVVRGKAALNGIHLFG